MKIVARLRVHPDVLEGFIESWARLRHGFFLNGRQVRAISYTFQITVKSSDDLVKKFERIAALQKACMECKKAPPLYCHACLEATLAKAVAPDQIGDATGADDEIKVNRSRPPSSPSRAVLTDPYPRRMSRRTRKPPTLDDVVRSLDDLGERLEKVAPSSPDGGAYNQGSSVDASIKDGQLRVTVERWTPINEFIAKRWRMLTEADGLEKMEDRSYVGRHFDPIEEEAQYLHPFWGHYDDLHFAQLLFQAAISQWIDRKPWRSYVDEYRDVPSACRRRIGSLPTSRRGLVERSRRTSLACARPVKRRCDAPVRRWTGALRLYVATKTDAGTLDLALAQRASMAQPFGQAAQLYDSAGEVSDEFQPFERASTLWFVTNREGQREIWSVSRKWLSEDFLFAAAVKGLANPADDGWPSPSADGLTVYFGSSRAGANGGQGISVAHRASVSAAFDPPAIVSELDGPGVEAPGWFSIDACRLYFFRDVGGRFALFVATKSQ